MTWEIVSSLPLTSDGSMYGVMDSLDASILTGLTLQPCLIAERAIVAVSRYQKSQALPQITAGILIGNLDGSGNQIVLGVRSLPPRPADSGLPGGDGIVGKIIRRGVNGMKAIAVQRVIDCCQPTIRLRRDDSYRPGRE